MQFDRQQVRQFIQKIPAFELASFPSEQPARGGVGEHDSPLRIQQDCTVGHGGDQGGLLHLSSGEFFDVGGVVSL